MAKGSWDTQYNKFWVSEESANFDEGTQNNLLRIVYDPMGNLSGYDSIEDKDGINVLNDQFIRSSKPLSIKEYKVTIATNCLAVVFQTYGNFDFSNTSTGANTISTWDTSSYEFQRALKKKVFIPGQINSTTSGWVIRTMHFKAEWIQPKKGSGFWKNGVKPIVLKPSACDTFNIAVKTLDSGDDKSFYSNIEILDYALAD